MATTLTFAKMAYIDVLSQSKLDIQVLLTISTVIPLRGNSGYRDILVKWRIALVGCLRGCFSVFSDIGSLNSLNFSIVLLCTRHLEN